MLNFISDYLEDSFLRKSFNMLAGDVFGIGFEEWIDRGWNRGNYIPYSFEDNGEIVSNASVNLMKLIIKGKLHNAVQIGTVMTKEGYRKQGLATQLIKRILQEYSGKTDFIYLFPNETEIKFYDKLGFSLNRYQCCTADIRGIKCQKADIRKLNIKSERDRLNITRIINEQSNLSDIFDVKENLSVRMWYYTYSLKENIYYIPEFDAVAAYSLKGGILSLIDFISTRKLNLENAIEVLKRDNTEKCKVMFTPSNEDFRDIRIEMSQGNQYFIIPQNSIIVNNYCIPFISQA